MRFSPVGATPARAWRNRERGVGMTTVPGNPVVRPRLLVLIGCAALIALVAAAPPARAQAVYGSIAGTVTDPSGAALPGVNITITSVERRTADTVVTNSSGNYAKGQLLPGVYEVKAELAGF